MYILSIQFSSSAKTYDYLFVNPKNVAMNLKRPLKVVNGANESAWKEIRIVGKKRINALPGYVTSQIVIDEGNVCVLEKIKASHVGTLSLPKKTEEKTNPGKTDADKERERSEFMRQSIEKILLLRRLKVLY